MKPLLYLTADGLMEALGFSQVVRVIEGLAERGWPYEVVSLEKPDDLMRVGRVFEIRSRLARAGIGWTALPWSVGGTARDALQNEMALVKVALARAKQGRIGGIHARAYHGGFAALACRVAWGTPYLFDTRSYWFDERLEEGRWFTSPLRLGIARGVEHQLFAQASGVVTLTELQASDVRSGRFGSSRHEVVQCITTCADFEDFVRRPPRQCRRVPESIRGALQGKRVLGLIGSINRSYLVDETLALVRSVLRRDEQAHLLVLSGQSDEYARRLTATGISADRFTLTRADHEAMPEWLSLIDWGMLLLNPDSSAKRASMPTKLAEFLACGVRPVQFGCNSEVSDWVKNTGSGFVLADVRPHTLEAAAERIVTTTLEDEVASRARSLAAPHFSLESGLDKYEHVLTRTFGELRPAALGNRAEIPSRPAT
ncbi:MAG: glycosyltransferase [Archangium sp.]|nr:glycosyltransferase [Archangium sp.]